MENHKSNNPKIQPRANDTANATSNPSTSGPFLGPHRHSSSSEQRRLQQQVAAPSSGHRTHSLPALLRFEHNVESSAAGGTLVGPNATFQCHKESQIRQATPSQRQRTRKFPRVQTKQPNRFLKVKQQTPKYKKWKTWRITFGLVVCSARRRRQKNSYQPGTSSKPAASNQIDAEKEKSNENQYFSGIQIQINQMHRLISVVQSASPEALKAAANLLCAHMSDQISHPIESHQNDRSQKRYLEATPSESSSSSSANEIAEPTELLLRKIRSINKRLVETRLELGSFEDRDPAYYEGGHVIVCNYNAVCKDSRILVPELKLRLIVPPDYPNASPIILKNLSNYPSSNAAALNKKAQTRFSESCRDVWMPISVEEIANAWDASARAVVVEYARGLGGGNFTSQYGSWETADPAGLD